MVGGVLGVGGVLVGGVLLWAVMSMTTTYIRTYVLRSLLWTVALLSRCHCVSLVDMDCLLVFELTVCS